MRDVTSASLDSLVPELIAPCGMNCGLCIGHVRKRNTCPGCNHPDDAAKAHHCAACAIKQCEYLAKSPYPFCGDCAKYPCRRLRDLDKRYRTKYRMSMLENLSEIRRIGVGEFVERERTRWDCPQCGMLVSVHRAECLACGRSVEDLRGAGL